MEYNIKNNLKDILGRIIKRDFSGNTGIIIKNSIFQFSTNLFSKIGSLLFTAIIARMLMPELFGLYSLAFSTITIFATLSELGTDATLTRFLAREIAKKRQNKAKGYTVYLARLKLTFSLISIFILVISARFISDTYYQKPLFLALIAGSLYIASVMTASYLRAVLQSLNYFKGVFYNEIVFQVVRLIIIPLLILLSLKNLFSNQVLLFFIILGFGFAYLVSVIFSWFVHKDKFNYLKKYGKPLDKSEKKNVRKFIIPTAATVITTLFFGSIDMVMLGRYVLPEYIGYYRAAFSLIAAITPLISFSIVLLPVFSKIRKNQLEVGIKKAIYITLLCSSVLFIFVSLLSPILINLIYGTEYSPAINLLRLFSLLLISTPLISIYISYFSARGKPFIVTKMLIFSLIMNIALNLLVVFLLKGYGDMFMVYGVTAATIISNWFYFAGLAIIKKRHDIKLHKEEERNSINFIKPEESPQIK